MTTQAVYFHNHRIESTGINGVCQVRSPRGITWTSSSLERAKAAILESEQFGAHQDDEAA